MKRSEVDRSKLSPVMLQYMDIKDLLHAYLHKADRTATDGTYLNIANKPATIRNKTGVFTLPSTGYSATSTRITAVPPTITAIRGCICRMRRESIWGTRSRCR